MPTICQFFRLIHVEIEGLMIDFAWQITCCGNMNKKNQYAAHHYWDNSLAIS